MPILQLNLNDFENLINRKFNIKEIEEMLFSYGMELDDYKNNELFIEITPDRPDMISKYGLVRALKKYLGIDNKVIKYTTKESGIEIFVDNSVNNIRPYISAAVVKGININEDILKDIIFAQEKLHSTFCRNRKISAIGIYPCNKICSPIMYLSKKPDEISFKPLGYDTYMTGSDILKKHETGKKFSFLLNDFERYPVLMDQKNRVLSMPPIINSEDIGKIDSNTTDIFIEVTGTNFVKVHQIINILSAMFFDIGGSLFSVKIIYKKKTDTTPNTNSRKAVLNLKNIETLLGLKLKSKEVISLLKMMGHGIENSNESLVNVLIPYYRTDILHEVDLIDDVGRAYGFNNIKPESPCVYTVGSSLKKTKDINFIKYGLIGLGFVECFTLSLSNKKYQYTNMNIESDEMIVLSNSKSNESNIMRTWIIPEIMRCVVSNKSHVLPMKLFEINDVCTRDDKTDTGYRNVTKLAVLITDSRTTFTDIKRVLDFLMKLTNKKYELKYSKHSSFIDGRVGDILLDNKKIGFIGELRPVVLKNWQWKYPVTCMEICFDDIF